MSVSPFSSTLSSLPSILSYLFSVSIIVSFFFLLCLLLAHSALTQYLFFSSVSLLIPLSVSPPLFFSYLPFHLSFSLRILQSPSDTVSLTLRYLQAHTHTHNQSCRHLRNRRGPVKPLTLGVQAVLILGSSTPLLVTPFLSSIGSKELMCSLLHRDLAPCFHLQKRKQLLIGPPLLGHKHRHHC